MVAITFIMKMTFCIAERSIFSTSTTENMVIDLSKMTYEQIE